MILTLLWAYKAYNFSYFVQINPMLCRFCNNQFFHLSTYLFHWWQWKHWCISLGSTFSFSLLIFLCMIDTFLHNIFCKYKTCIYFQHHKVYQALINTKLCLFILKCIIIYALSASIGHKSTDGNIRQWFDENEAVISVGCKWTDHPPLLVMVLWRINFYEW